MDLGGIYGWVFTPMENVVNSPIEIHIFRRDIITETPVVED